MGSRNQNLANNCDINWNKKRSIRSQRYRKELYEERTIRLGISYGTKIP